MGCLALDNEIVLMSADWNVHVTSTPDDMDTNSRWLSSPWKLLLLLLLLLQVVYTCPTECTCSRLPGNKLLSSLLLSNNSISNVKLEMEYVICVDQSLTQLPEDIPTNVIFLDVSHNKLVSIDNTFYSLTKLKTLILKNNKVTTLDNAMFGNLFQLENLVFGDNTITVIQPQTFKNLGNVENLSLAGNHLSSLNDEVFKGLNSLKSLRLCNNDIDTIGNQTFTTLDNLEILDLSFNVLEVLHPHIFHGLVHLRVLNLTHNKITYISSQTFEYLKRLEVLILSHNNLQSTSDFLFSGLNALKTLDLSTNLLTSVTQMTFNNISKLTSLRLDSNPISEFNSSVFKSLHSLQNLSVTQMPVLTHLSYNTFEGLDNLEYLNLSLNQFLSFINPHLFSTQTRLQYIDLHGNNITYLSALTFHYNHNLTQLNLKNNPLLCSCDIAWLAKYNENTTCVKENGDLIPVSHVTNVTFPCANIEHNTSESNTLYFKLGSAARLTCNVSLDSTMIVIWTTPRKKVLTYHAFHPNATRHHPDPNYINAVRDWANSTSYHSEMIYRQDRVILLSDASLYIDYILRSDAGSYKCEVRNAYHNISIYVYIWLDFTILYDIKIWSLVVGVCCAFSFFVLIVVYTTIRACTVQIVNKRRRETIRQLLENLDVYKQNQITRIRDNYSTQLCRVSDHYHNQLERLRNNYSMQMGRVKRGCSHQVDRIRDNYGSQVGRLKEYSSHQIDQLRSAYNNQVLKIRDFGSLQYDRLRETCKQQQMNVMKLMETMNIENCKGIIESECIRTESMIFEPQFENNDDDIQGLSLIGSESDYVTASDTDDSKSNHSQTMEVDMGEQLEFTGLDDKKQEMENFMYDVSEQSQIEPPITLELDLGDISLETVI